MLFEHLYRSRFRSSIALKRFDQLSSIILICLMILGYEVGAGRLATL